MNPREKIRRGAAPRPPCASAQHAAQFLSAPRRLRRWARVIRRRAGEHPAALRFWWQICEQFRRAASARLCGRPPPAAAPHARGLPCRHSATRSAAAARRALARCASAAAAGFAPWRAVRRRAVPVARAPTPSPRPLPAPPLPQHARAHVHGPRPRGQAPQAPRRPRLGRWPAPPPHADGPIVRGARQG
jgi:hypothetical protein